MYPINLIKNEMNYLFDLIYINNNNDLRYKTSALDDGRLTVHSNH